jgi:hypothetical protein
VSSWILRVWILRVLAVFGLSLFLAFGAVIVLVCVELGFEPEYDSFGPDFEHFDGVFSQYNSDQYPIQTLDLAPLNGGNWIGACVFGGYSDPIEVAEKRMLLIDPLDTQRFEEARHSGFRVASVEETEAALLWWKADAKAHFVFFRNGAPGITTTCVGRGKPVVTFEGW